MNELALDSFSKNIINKKGEIDIAVDMTCGNGNDTLFLSKISKIVHAFDIQEAAIENTRELLAKNGKENVSLHLTSFENFEKYVIKADVFIYNLGYLPGGDKSICTNYNSSIKSLNRALHSLNNGGIISIMSYQGHEEGFIEKTHVEQLVSKLDNKLYEVLKFDMINKNNPPILYIILKK